MATLTINTTAEHATRVAAAFGRLRGLRNPDSTFRDATTAEVKQEVINFLTATVLSEERGEAAETAAATIIEIEPT